MDETAEPPPPPVPADGRLYDFLRRWAWPFDEADRDIAEEGSAFTLHTRERGFLDGEILVFSFDDRALVLAPNAAHPQRRLTLSPAEVDALAPAMAAYLDGAMGFEAFAASHPAAAALLALRQEAWTEAAAAAATPTADDD